MPQPETVLVNSIRRAILDRWPAAWVFKVAGSPYQMAGVPDLLVAVEGRLVGVEVKKQRAGESTTAALSRVTARQHAQLDALRRAGAGALVALTVEEALAGINTHLQHARGGN